MNVVLGRFRGGTSCMAGVLSQLGCSFGNELKPANKHNLNGFFEDVPLALICRKCIKEPVLEKTEFYPQFKEMMDEWIMGHAARTKIDTIKHPSLAFMIPQLVELFHTVKFIWIRRPVEDSVKSLKAAGWWVSVDREAMCKKIDAAIVGDLFNMTHYMYVDYDELVDDPYLVIGRLAEFLEIDPTFEQIKSAAHFVDPELRRSQCIKSGSTGKAHSRIG